MKKTAMLVLLGGMLAMFCTGCDEGTGWEESFPTETTTETIASEAYAPPETLSQEEIDKMLENTSTKSPSNESSGEVPHNLVDSPDDFGTAVYLCRQEDDSEQYYFFYGDGTGRYLSQDDGTETLFTYEMQGTDKAIFHIGETVQSADVCWFDENTANVIWDNGVGSFSRLSDDPYAEFRFYPNSVLSERAIALYEQESGNHADGSYVWIDYDEFIVIQLYETMSDGYEVASEWYTIDRYTGIGRDIIGNTVNLSDTPDVLPAETTAATEEGTAAAVSETTTVTTAASSDVFTRR